MYLGRKKPAKAKLIGTTLVATFYTSNPSLIWKFDLERNHSFTLALQGEEGDLELGVTSPKGEFYPVARFAVREDAEEAFTAVQKVLMKKRIFYPKNVLAWIGIAVLVFFLLLFSLRYLVNSNTTTTARPTSSPVAQPGVPAVIPQGVPLPADQVLRPPP